MAVGFNVHILTKGPSSNPLAWAEKMECVRKHFDDNVTIHITEDKGVHYGRVLVDDYPAYVNAWLAHRPRGLVIMPAHPYNEKYAHQNVIRYDGTNEAFEELMVMLRMAKTRQPLEHWRKDD